MKVYNIKNSIYWNTLGYRRYDNDVPFYLTLGLEHNFTYHAGYVDILTQERFNNINYSNIRANTGIILNILKSTKIEHYGPLGLDDFPTGLKVVCELKRAKSRDKRDIEKLTVE